MQFCPVSPKRVCLTFFAAYRRNEKTAVRVLEKYTRDLFAESTLSCWLQPEDVIIGGDLADFADDVIVLGINQLKLTQGFLGYENTRTGLRFCMAMRPCWGPLCCLLNRNCSR
jgi:predicted NBD/HSP70 family sugar kinase